MAGITHILFDSGNTLMFFDGSWPEALRAALEALGGAAVGAGLSVDPAVLAQRFGERLERYYAEREIDLLEPGSAKILEETLSGLGLREPPEFPTRALLAAFYRVTQDHWKPLPGAIGVLRRLRGLGLRLGMLSNAADEEDVRFLTDRAGLRPYFDFVLTSVSIGRRKPHPAAFQAALALWKVEPAHVLMVGDTLNADILGAKNVGMATVWVRQYSQSVSDGRIVADYEIDRLGELVEVLQR